MAQSAAYAQAQAQAKADADAAAAASSPTPLAESPARVVWKALRNGLEILASAAEVSDGGADRVGGTASLVDSLASVWGRLFEGDLSLATDPNPSQPTNIVVASSKLEKG